jgi:hypothetical protein
MESCGVGKRNSEPRAIFIVLSSLPTSTMNTSGDDFVNVLFAPEDDGSSPINDAQKKDKDFYNHWVDKCMLLQSIYLF